MRRNRASEREHRKLWANELDELRREANSREGIRMRLADLEAEVPATAEEFDIREQRIASLRQQLSELTGCH